MDYSLLVGIEALETKDINDDEEADLFNRKHSTLLQMSQLEEINFNNCNKSQKVSIGKVEAEKKITVSKCGRFKYHIAIIDYLQRYNLLKKSETVAKTLFFKEANPESISSQPVEPYAKRFINYLQRDVFRFNSSQLFSLHAFKTITESVNDVPEMDQNKPSSFKNSNNFEKD
eukprot:CAMPEP_0170506058 /NCGR_PEP_ID=MMETSP0208-20121228/53403_1 /TAXON_ID=197538 /ORGANISM="Strombidium inclinatum, Strain S3" /LENGTH=172 /DNA_ID=CAMNT_0010787333 /DNA_START=1608 /DNA_END=2123 /DNA_ORIENTATION=-